MITHKTYKTTKGEWIMPKDVVLKDGKFIKNKRSFGRRPKRENVKVKKML